MSKMKIILPIAFLFASLFLINFVSGATGLTLISPATNAVLGNTTAVLNVSNNTGTGTPISEMLNCTWTASSPSTENSTYVKIGFAVNSTTNASSINMTFPIKALSDSNDYVINVTCVNASNTKATASSTGITIDHGVPQAPVLTLATNTVITSAETRTFTSTVVDYNTTACNYRIGRGDVNSETTNGSATYATTSCSFTKTFTDTSDNGDWYWQISASDGTNTTTSAPNIFSVQIAPTGGGVLPNSNGGVTIPGQTTTNNNLIFILIAIVVVVVLLVKFSKRR